MITLKDGSRVEDPRLGRIPSQDAKSRSFPIRALSASNAKPRSYTWRCNEWFDQGREGACVGFAIGHELAARPAEIRGLNYDILVKDFYWEAQKIDEWDGGSYPGASPQYAGTSVLAGLKVGKRLGYFEEYRWAFGIDDLIMGLGRNGPAVLGIPWFQSMYSPDSEGFIKPGGQLAGGHAILARAVNVNTEVITLRNSWGKEWGQNGDCYITFRDMEKMLTEEEGEAAFALQRKRKPVS